jgi:nucleotide-binding universal stress UspA family protein
VPHCAVFAAQLARRITVFDKILLPTDGSDTSIAAADRAVALAKLAGAPLQVVFIQEPYPYAGVGAASPFGVQEYEAAAQRAALQAFERIRAIARVPGVHVEAERIEAPEPAQAIVDAAKACGADIIVMGSHGRTGLARVLLGSVASRVLALSPIPVMIIK